MSVNTAAEIRDEIWQWNICEFNMLLSVEFASYQA